MKQKYTLYSMIMILVETICLFIPGSYQTDNWHPEVNSLGWEEWKKIPSQPLNIFDLDRVGIEIGPGNWIAYVVILLMAVSFAAFLFAYLYPEHKYAKYAYYTPIVSFVVLTGFTFYACAFAEMAPYLTRWEWDIGWLFYIIITLHILTIIFSILIKYAKFDEKAMPFVLPQKSSGIDKVEEMKKYKELLDSGVITQEEFNAKKRQLLGL